LASPCPQRIDLRSKSAEGRRTKIKSMKLWVKILLTSIIVLSLLYIFIHIFLFFQGKAVIIKQLERLTQKKVSIAYFGIIPPLNLDIENLVIENLAKADSIYVSPSILGFLTGNIAFNNIKIIRPEFTYERALSSATGLPAAVTAGEGRKPAARFIFKRLKIQDGKINFIDHTIADTGISLTLKDINFSLDNLFVLPHSVITNFDLRAKIPWEKGTEEGRVSAEGWLDLFKKNMQASLKIEDIDGVYLYPYYSTWVDLEKARIEKAKLNFSSNIHSLNNDMVADCHLELTDIVRKPRSAEEPEEKAEKITNAVLDIFRALNQGKIILDFTIRTKMDRPEFGFGSIRAAFEEKLVRSRKGGAVKVEDVLKFPANLLQGTVKSATDLTNAVIDGVFSVGRELKRAVEDTLKK